MLQFLFLYLVVFLCVSLDRRFNLLLCAVTVDNELAKKRKSFLIVSNQFTLFLSLLLSFLTGMVSATQRVLWSSQLPLSKRSSTSK